MNELSKPDLTAEEVQEEVKSYAQRGVAQLDKRLLLQPVDIAEAALASGLRSDPKQLAVESFNRVPEAKQAATLHAMAHGAGGAALAGEVGEQAALRCKQAGMPTLLDDLTSLVAADR